VVRRCAAWIEPEPPPHPRWLGTSKAHKGTGGEGAAALRCAPETRPLASPRKTARYRCVEWHEAPCAYCPPPSGGGAPSRIASPSRTLCASSCRSSVSRSCAKALRNRRLTGCSGPCSADQIIKSKGKRRGNTHLHHTCSVSRAMVALLHHGSAKWRWVRPRSWCTSPGGGTRKGYTGVMQCEGYEVRCSYRCRSTTMNSRSRAQSALAARKSWLPAPMCAAEGGYQRSAWYGMLYMLRIYRLCACLPVPHLHRDRAQGPCRWPLGSRGVSCICSSTHCLGT
jgi:hypothetical protein